MDVDPAASLRDLQRTIKDLEERLEALTRVKHEISNPLMGLLGSAELLAGHPELPESCRNRVFVILSEARRIKSALATPPTEPSQ